MRSRYSRAAWVGVAVFWRKRSANSWMVSSVSIAYSSGVSSMIRGTRKNSPLRSGAFASMSSCGSDGTGSSSRVTELRAHAEGQVVVHIGRRGSGHGTAIGRIGARRVQQHDLVLGDFQEKARGLSHPVTLDAAVERIGEPQPLFRPRDAHVKEP